VYSSDQNFPVRFVESKINLRDFLFNNMLWASASASTQKCIGAYSRRLANITTHAVPKQATPISTIPSHPSGRGILEPPQSRKIPYRTAPPRRVPQAFACEIEPPQAKQMQRQIRMSVTRISENYRFPGACRPGLGLEARRTRHRAKDARARLCRFRRGRDGTDPATLDHESRSGKRKRLDKR